MGKRIQITEEDINMMTKSIINRLNESLLDIFNTDSSTQPSVPSQYNGQLDSSFQIGNETPANGNPGQGVGNPSVLAQAQSFVGTKEGTPNFKSLIDSYNALGHSLSYTQPWCAAFASLCLNKAGKKSIGSASSVRLAKQAGANYHPQETGWIPKPGDIMIFQKNGSSEGHTGIVKSYDPQSGTLVHIDGNYSNKVSVVTDKFIPNKVIPSADTRKTVKLIGFIDSASIS